MSSASAGDNEPGPAMRHDLAQCVGDTGIRKRSKPMSRDRRDCSIVVENEHALFGGRDIFQEAAIAAGLCCRFGHSSLRVSFQSTNTNIFGEGDCTEYGI